MPKEDKKTQRYRLIKGDDWDGILYMPIGGSPNGLTFTDPQIKTKNKDWEKHGN